MRQSSIAIVGAVASVWFSACAGDPTPADINQHGGAAGMGTTNPTATTYGGETGNSSSSEGVGGATGQSAVGGTAGVTVTSAGGFGSSTTAGAPSTGASTGGAGGSGTEGFGGTTTGGTAGIDGGASGNAGSAGTGSTGDDGACEQGQVAADEVLIIGDSYFPAARSAIVVELRRLASADYRDRSVPGAKMDAIIRQYDAAPAPQPKVVIMDGGGNDVLQNPGCSPGCDQHVAAVTQARDFFARVQGEGVQDIVFLFYYDMPWIKGGLDWMRPELRDECEQSPVPCHFVDVQPLFAGQDASEYTTDGIHPTAEAGRTIAGAIWSVMQENCVAQ